MQISVTELVAEFARQARLPESAGQEDVYLQSLVDDFEPNSAMFRRDMRRMLEKDSRSFVRAACRVLKQPAENPGTVYLAELLWSSTELVKSLADPQLMPLRAAIALAKLWTAAGYHAPTHGISL